MQSPTSRRSLLNYIGIFILLAGMGVGEFIYWRSFQGGSGTDDEDPLLSQYDSRVYQRNMQMYVGTFGLIMDQWSRAAAKLGEPRPLAITITVASMLAAGGCFMVAPRLTRKARSAFAPKGLEDSKTVLDDLLPRSELEFSSAFQP